MAIKRTHLMMMDIILVGLSLVLVLGFVGYARPLAIAPLEGLVTSESAILFEFDKADLILLDDNSDFSSPEEIYVENNLVINLEPGNYYWKASGLGNSEARRLTIRDVVALQLKESSQEGKYDLINVGNTFLDVQIYENGSLTGSKKLAIDQAILASGDEFRGGKIDE